MANVACLAKTLGPAVTKWRSPTHGHECVRAGWERHQHVVHGEGRVKLCFAKLFSEEHGREGRALASGELDC